MPQPGSLHSRCRRRFRIPRRRAAPPCLPGGKVVGIDHILALVDWSGQKLKNDGIGAAIGKGELVMARDGREGYVSPGRPAFLLILSPD